MQIDLMTIKKKMVIEVKKFGIGKELPYLTSSNIQPWE